MANVTTGNPFIIDTETATAIVATGNIFEVWGLVWSSGSLDDSVLAAEADGIVKWRAKGAAANARIADHMAQPIKFNGLKVSTLNSGVLYIYVRRIQSA